MSAATNPASAQDTNADNRTAAREVDPSMEEILASIRRIIADDQALPLTPRGGEPEPEAAEEPVAEPVRPPAPRPAKVSRVDEPDSDFEVWLSETAKRAREDQADPGAPVAAASNGQKIGTNPEQQSAARPEQVSQTEAVSRLPRIEPEGGIAPAAAMDTPYAEPVYDDVVVDGVADRSDAEAHSVTAGWPDVDRKSARPDPGLDDDWEIPAEFRRRALAASMDAGLKTEADDWDTPVEREAVDASAVQAAEEAAAVIDNETGERAEEAVAAADGSDDDAEDDLDAPVSPETDGPRLLSGDTTSSVSSSFQALAESVMAQNSTMVQQEIRGMLKPMLKQWLDDNLPTMVERLVRAEIERVARGGP